MLCRYFSFLGRLELDSEYKPPTIVSFGFVDNYFTGKPAWNLEGHTSSCALNQVLYVEGRNLGLQREISNPKRENNMKVEAGGGRTVQREKTKQEEDEVDSFRPTKPGYSPGVGHSINN